jgi:hypothetical protein
MNKLFETFRNFTRKISTEYFEIAEYQLWFTVFIN